MKTETKAMHTPGPWTIEYEVKQDLWGIIYQDALNICTLTHIDSLKNEANARLISAAPDLLEALKRTLQLIEEFPATPEIQRHFSNAFRGDVEAQAHRAIAKAEGN